MRSMLIRSLSSLVAALTLTCAAVAPGIALEQPSEPSAPAPTRSQTQITRGGRTVTIPALPTSRLPDGREFVTGRIIVGFTSDTTGGVRSQVHGNVDARVGSVHVMQEVG